MILPLPTKILLLVCFAHSIAHGHLKGLCLRTLFLVTQESLTLLSKTPQKKIVLGNSELNKRQKNLFFMDLSHTAKDSKIQTWAECSNL